MRRKIATILFLLADLAIISIVAAIFTFGIFYLVPVKSYSDQTVNNIFIGWLAFFIGLLLLLMVFKKAREILFSESTTLISGFLLLVFILMLYASEAINTFQAFFRKDIAKPHDYQSVPIFVGMTILFVLAGIFLGIRKLKRKLKAR